MHLSGDARTRGILEHLLEVAKRLVSPPVGAHVAAAAEGLRPRLGFILRCPEDRVCHRVAVAARRQLCVAFELNRHAANICRDDRRARSERVEVRSADDLGCVELLDLYLKRVEAYNPELNAIIATDIEGARKRAKAADKAVKRAAKLGPLHGVPMTIKESYDVAGFPTTWGHAAFKDGELWLSMLWRSRKAADLGRDPRVLVYSIVTGRDGGQGRGPAAREGLRDADELGERRVVHESPPHARRSEAQPVEP